MGAKTVVLSLALVFALVGSVLLALTTFLPEFVVASEAGNEECVMGHVGPYFSTWDATCSSNPLLASSEPFESGTLEYWPLFPLQNLEAHPAGELLGPIYQNVDDCNLTTIDAIAEEGSADLAALQAGLGFDFSTPESTLVADTRFNGAFPGGDAAPQTRVISFIGMYVATVLDTYKKMGVPDQNALAGLAFANPIHAGVSVSINQAAGALSGCVCPEGGWNQQVFEGSVSLWETGAFLALPTPIPAVNGSSLVNPCPEDAVFNPLAYQAGNRSALACFGYLNGYLNAQVGSLYSLFNSGAPYEPITEDGAVVEGGSVSEQATQACKDDVEDAEAISLAATLLTVAFAVGLVGVLVGVAAVVLQVNSVVTILASVLALAAAGLTAFALLTVYNAPVYSNVGGDCESVCYEKGMGFYTGVASIGVPVVASLLFVVSLCVKNAEPDYDVETSLISDKA